MFRRTLCILISVALVFATVGHVVVMAHIGDDGIGGPHAAKSGSDMAGTNTMQHPDKTGSSADAVSGLIDCCLNDGQPRVSVSCAFSACLDQPAGVGIKRTVGGARYWQRLNHKDGGRPDRLTRPPRTIS